MKSLLKFFKNRDLLAIVILLAVVVVFGWKIFLKNAVLLPADIIVGMYHPWFDQIWKGFIAGVPWKNGILSDPVSSLYPWKIYGLELIKNGEIPLWNSITHAGTPLLANFESNVINPFNILYFIFNNAKAWSYELLSHILLSGIFCYLFLKNLRLSRFSSLIGSIAFMFNGVFVAWLELGIETRAGLFIPLVLLLVDKFISTGRIRYFIAEVLVVSFQSLGGYPQVSIYIYLLFTVYVLFRLFENRNDKAKKQRSLILMICAPLSLAVSAVQYIPGLELYISSIRKFDNPPLDQRVMPWTKLIVLIIPDFFGNPTTQNTWGWANYLETSQYIGMLPIVMAVFAAAVIKEKIVRFFTAITLIFFSFTLPTPWGTFLSESNLPIFSNAGPTRILILTVFTLSVLSAFGINYVQKKTEFKRNPAIISIPFLIIVIAIMISFYIARTLITSQLLSIPQENGVAFIKQNTQYLMVTIRNSILPALFILIVSVWIFAFNRFKNNILLKIIALAFVIFDLLRFSWKFLPFSDPDYIYPDTTITDFLKSQEKPFRSVGLIPTNFTIPYRIDTVEGNDPLGIVRYNQFFNAAAQSGSPTTGRRYLNVDKFSDLLSLVNVKYHLQLAEKDKNGNVETKLKMEPTRFKLIKTEGQTQVYEDTKSLPRAFIVYDYKVESENQRIIDTLKDKRFDFSKSIVLEKDPDVKFTLPKNPGKVEFLRSFAGQTIVKTNSEENGLLFLSETYFPGWKAYVDGKQVPIMRADYAFKSIVIPKGNHTVKFNYDPISFKIGVIVTISALSALFSLALLKRNEL